MDRFEQLEADTSIVDYSDLKVRKVNKTLRAIFGAAHHHVPFGNEYELEVLVYMKQGGEYRLLPYKKTRTPFCEFCKSDE